MPDHHWQKSTFSPDASNCVYVATAPTGHVLLRESDTPTTILTTTPAPLRSLIQTLKGAETRKGRVSSTTRPHS